jgi:hypothetical protein
MTCCSTRGFAWLLAGSLLLALASCGSPPPPQKSPTAPLPLPDLNAAPGPRIGQQLRQLRVQPRQCFALLERTRGLSVTPIADTNERPGCGLRQAGEIKSSRIAFARPTQASCAMIAGLHLWQREVVEPAARQHLGQAVVRIETFGTYACRNRNNQPDARISEHASANAIDISAFVLADGRKVSVLRGWRGGSNDEQAFLRAIHRGGCRFFSVVLGPESDRFHQDHFHFDMGPWPVCR